MALAKFARICGKNIGGNSGFYVVPVADIDTITVTAGEISALTMAVGKKFLELQPDEDSLIRTEEGEGVGSTMKYTHRIESRFSNPSVTLNTLRNELAAASPCGIVAIVTDGNGKSWLVGYNETDGFRRPLRLKQDSINSGAALGEENSQAAQIALEGTSGYLCLPFDSTLGAAIIAGTSAFIDFV